LLLNPKEGVYTVPSGPTVSPSLGTGPPGKSGRIAKISVSPRSQAPAGIMPPVSSNAASDVPINALFITPPAVILVNFLRYIPIILWVLGNRVKHRCSSYFLS